MQDAMEQIYYVIAIGRYFILTKGTKICVLLKSFWDFRGCPDERNLLNYWVRKKTASCIISHNYFSTCNEPTDSISNGNRVI